MMEIPQNKNAGLSQRTELALKWIFEGGSGIRFRSEEWGIVPETSAGGQEMDNGRMDTRSRGHKRWMEEPFYSVGLRNG